MRPDKCLLETPRVNSFIYVLKTEKMGYYDYFILPNKNFFLLNKMLFLSRKIFFLSSKPYLAIILNSPCSRRGVFQLKGRNRNEMILS
jgi:hypothetical protein